MAFKEVRNMKKRLPWLLAAAVLLALAVGARVSSGLRSADATFAVSYTGTDYYFPSDYFNVTARFWATKKRERPLSLIPVTIPKKSSNILRNTA